MSAGPQLLDSPAVCRGLPSGCRVPSNWHPAGQGVQQLSGLEAMHCATAQATAHETINRGHVERGATYNILQEAGEDPAETSQGG